MTKPFMPSEDVSSQAAAASMRRFRHPLLEAFAHAKFGELRVVLPRNETYIFQGWQNGPKAALYLKDLHVLDNLVTRGEIGFAEAYMDGKWESDDLPALLTYGLLNADVFERYFYGKPVQALFFWMQSLFHGNSLHGSRRNIAQHYDLGNKFYALWLDKSMTYSCGLFGGDESLSLEEAQQAKYRRILKKLKIRPGDHILELGCGCHAPAHICRFLAQLPPACETRAPAVSTRPGRGRTRFSGFGCSI